MINFKTMYNKIMKLNQIIGHAVIFIAALSGVILFYGCAPVTNYVYINSSSEYEEETAFLETILTSGDLSAHGLQLLPSGHDINAGEKDSHPAFYIDFFTSWENEVNNEDIILSRKIFIPYDDVLEGRTDTTLEACLSGKENLIQIDELEPPFTAIRVNGFAVGDEGYPLVQVVSVRINIDDSKKTDKSILKNLDHLRNAIIDAPKTLIQSMPEPLWIAVGGDTMLERGATELLFEEGPAAIFGETAKMLALADIALLNLEGVISARGERVPKSYNFRFVPEIAAALKNAGIDAVLHANNHVFDYGEQAFLDSLSWLNKAGIGIAGAGVDDNAASDPYIHKKGDQVCRVFGIASFPRENNGWDGETAAAGPERAGMLHARRGGVEKLKQKFAPNSLNVVLFHGGVEWSTKPDAATRALYTDLIASGADLVIGTHPHVVQGFEWVLGKPVFWSLGNYVFGQMNGFFTGDEGLFVRLGFWHGKLLYMEPFPIFLNDIRTDIVSKDKLKVFYERSRELRKAN